MKIKKLYILSFAMLVLAACGDDKNSNGPSSPGNGGGDSPEEPGIVTSARDEQYRPQVHFTPSRNWINDPNGMVYADGVWHLYYQCNPYGNGWGNMSWGHASSADLMHWDEHPVAMVRNRWGDIFSGSAIVDKDNVAGFGANAIIAFYTGTDPKQQQCMAYSTDGGMTYTQYSGNPIIPNQGVDDFRDPKVFRHDASGRYVMCLAKGWEHKIEFWGSANLINWEKLSDFTIENARVNQGQFECPDLFKLPYKDGEKWILIISNNPGGPVGGSGTEYIVGDFDGTTFTADELDYPLWLDYGADNYAGVTWSNAPGGRTVMIGWMNNWNYSGDVPCSPWRSAMTLPRELSLVEVDGKPLLATKVVREIDAIAGDWKEASDGVCFGGSAYEIKVKVNTKKSSSFKIANGNDQYLEVSVNPSSNKIITKRTGATGDISFHGLFSIPSVAAPMNTEAEEMELHIYVDSSSVEIINGEGTMAITNLVFPSEPYDRIIGLEGVSFRPLKSIWQ